jgi:ATP-dependent RNA helicase MRH4
MGDIDFTHLPLVDGASEFELRRDDAAEGGKASHRSQRPIDVMVGTAGRMLDLTRGRQWRDAMEKLMGRNPWGGNEEKTDNSIARLNPAGWKPSIDLSQVDWVVMDEADVVYGPDFVQTTEMLLNDIASAKMNKPLSTVGKGSPHPGSPYPFNLILCTATIPNSLDHYISTNYPSMERLTSDMLHQIPRSITPEHVPYSGGNRAADIAARIRKVWSEDEMERGGEKSKILLFCNKSSKVEGLAQYLNEHQIPAVPLVRVLERGKRKKNNDNSIESFLKLEETGARVRRKEAKIADSGGAQPEPRVLVTTSLLSRGLDFSPLVKHVFIVDEPNNMVDFIHRAGRTGRAGQQGKVVIFSKSKGRGSARTMTGIRGEVMQKIGLRPTRHHFRRPADAFAS